MKRGLLLLAMVGCVSTPPPSKGPKRLSKAKRDRIKARANTNFIDDNIRPTDAAGSEAGANKPGALSRTISNSLPASLCTTPIPADKGYVSSVFGWRVFPGNKHKTLHVGVDIAAPTGTPIKSMTKGVHQSLRRRQRRRAGGHQRPLQRLELPSGA